jgi:hypothetical protein
LVNANNSDRKSGGPNFLPRGNTNGNVCGFP